jgi:cell division protein FtsW
MQRTFRTMLLVVVAALIVFGMLMLYSTSYATFENDKILRQSVWIGLGLISAGVLRLLDYRLLCRYAPWILLINAAALAYLAGAHLLDRLPFIPDALVRALPFTGGIKGSYRWLILGPIRLQPSEFAKIGIVLFMAGYFGRNSRYLGEFRRGFLIPMVAVGVVTLLVLLGGSLSVTAITALIVFLLAFVAGVRLRYLVPIALCGALLVAGVVSFARRELERDNQDVRAALASGVPARAEGVRSGGGERLRRIKAWLAPELYQETDGYQLWHSQLALGSGGWRGLGFTESRMKKKYLPEAHTDFIIAIVGEELGFVAVALVLGAYACLTLCLLGLAAGAPDREGALICTGMALAIGLHACVNLGVVSGLLPTTGVTAPFISYGGSSVLASGIGLGLALSVARVSEHSRPPRTQDGGATGKPAPATYQTMFG